MNIKKIFTENFANFPQFAESCGDGWREPVCQTVKKVFSF